MELRNCLCGQSEVKWFMPVPFHFSLTVAKTTKTTVTSQSLGIYMCNIVVAERNLKNHFGVYFTTCVGNNLPFIMYAKVTLLCALRNR